MGMSPDMFVDKIPDADKVIKEATELLERAKNTKNIVLVRTELTNEIQKQIGKLELCIDGLIGASNNDNATKYKETIEKLEKLSKGLKNINN